MNSEDDRLKYIVEEIEEKYTGDDSKYAAETDKSWGAMYQGLSRDGLDWEGGDYPLNHTVIAGDTVSTKSHYIISLKTPE